MDKAAAYRYALFFFGMTVCCTASKVMMTVNPQTIIPILTKTLKLRCSVMSESVEVIGRRDVISVIVPETFTSQVDVSHVTSIIVSRMNPETKVNVTVATVSSFDPPTAKVDLDKISVTGSTNSKIGTDEKGFLELTWDHPLEDQDGVYICDIYALNSDLHPESLTVSTQVKTSTATLPDLVKYISDNDRHIEALQARVHQLEDQISVLELNEQNQTQELHQNFETINGDIQRLEILTGNLTGQNIQTGNVTCTTDGVISIKFERSYAFVPDVFIAINNMVSNNYAFAINPKVNVNTDGFRLQCTSSSASSYGVSWIAIDN